VARRSGNGEKEYRTLSYTGRRIEVASVTLDNSPAESESEPGARILGAVQALEQAENTFMMLLVNADAVVMHRELSCF
jgi:hypothetical protein